MLDQIYRHELAWRISGVAIKQSPPGLIAAADNHPRGANQVGRIIYSEKYM